jgi:uncharacterized delta-60 repeat protein
VKAKRIFALLCILPVVENVSGALSSGMAIDPTFQRVTLDPDRYGYKGIIRLAEQPDGRIVIGGVFTGVNGQVRNGIARLNSNGSLDGSFVPTLPTNSAVRTMALQADGKIVIDADTGHGPVTRLNGDGSIDDSFKLPPHAAQWILPPEIYVRADGQVFLAGPQVRSADDSTNLFVAEVSATGDLAFNVRMHWYCHCFMTEQGVVKIGFQSDLKLIVGGYFSTDAGHRSLARFNLDGSEDLTFDTTAVSQDFYPTAVIIQPDDKIIYAGGNIGGPQLVRFNSDGTLDKRFPLPENVDIVASVALQADGKILATTSGDMGRTSKLVRYNADGTVHSTFQSPYVGKPIVERNGRILLAGSFTIPGPTGETNTMLLRLRGEPLAFNGGAVSGSKIRLEWKVLDTSLAFVLQSSENLTNWTTMRTIPAGATAIVVDKPGGDKRFFRVLHD